MSVNGLSKMHSKENDIGKVNTNQWIIQELLPRNATNNYFSQHSHFKWASSLESGISETCWAPELSWYSAQMRLSESKANPTHTLSVAQFIIQWNLLRTIEIRRWQQTAIFLSYSKPHRYIWSKAPGDGHYPQEHEKWEDIHYCVTGQTEKHISMA